MYEKYRKRKNIIKKRINKEIIKIVIYKFEDMEKCLLQCNKYMLLLLLFPSILSINIHPGLNFIQVSAKKQYIYIQILLSKRIFQFRQLCVHIIITK